MRLGEISFVNALPLSLSADVTAHFGIQKTSLPPTALNQAMAREALDISPVSSAFYLRHKDDFHLLDGISISAEKPVESVLLFLPQGFEGLTPQSSIAVPDTSETSVALMQYIIYHHTGLKLKKTTHYPIQSGADYIHAGLPVLAIGDEALTLKMDPAVASLPSVDLAEAWQALTSLPFVFAVWIAQRSWAEAYPNVLADLNRHFIEQKLRFYTDLTLQENVLQAAQRQCPHLPDTLLKHYFTEALSYNLDQQHRMALSWFGNILEWLDNDAETLSNGDRPELPIELLHR